MLENDVYVQCFALNGKKFLSSPGDNPWDDIFMIGFNTSSTTGKSGKVIMCQSLCLMAMCQQQIIYIVEFCKDAR